jgi:hypothetical protein
MKKFVYCENMNFYNRYHINGRFRIRGKLDGTSDFFPKELFITLEQHRQNQLEKIL